ncbi:hypothetical protein [Streptomyces tailanensis]|nr:hypothetical protein [Streptomyces tailanensis]
MHTFADDVRDTDWSQVVALHDKLVRLAVADRRAQPSHRGGRA